MTLDELRVQAAEIIGGLDGFPAPWMRETFLKVPRHAFVPNTVWVWGEDAYRPLRAADEPDTWAALVYDPLHPLVTQVDDGQVVGGDADARGALPTSSISAPNAVFTMLAAADVRPGMKVLEIGTGTGYNAAMLCERAGEANVVSVEVDAGLAEGPFDGWPQPGICRAWWRATGSAAGRMGRRTTGCCARRRCTAFRSRGWSRPGPVA
ncbi:rRNA adenine N-6-methyltransferase family protein [Streptomyces sp. FXJ1.4098]|nr:rRNA adenine N-6-methyltransferase family protein [Streptomyces sp. FXJ1.4098]